METFEIQLATSRFQATDRILESGLVPVRISRGAPRWKLRYQLAGAVSSLAPSKDLYAKRGTPEFEGEYVEQLSAIDSTQLHGEFRNLSEDNGKTGLVLLCFEDVEELGEGSCHRRMFARWWQSQTGDAVPEL